MGDRGRLVIPAELREQLGLTEGTVVVFVETDDGVTLMSRDRLQELVWAANSGGPSMVDELIAERRQAARDEDAE
jgi:AbrB family looped-hinge helix DNA binding protein